MKLVVIGAGIIGASIAWSLSRRRDVSVTVIERDRPCAGASGHSFAWTNAFGKEPLHYHELNRRSMDLWPRFAADAGVERAHHRGGELHVENTSGGADALKRHVARLQSWGYPCRLVDAGEVQALEPDLVVDSMTAASYSERDGHVDVPAVIEACLQQARERGAVVMTQTPLTGLSFDASNRVEAVVTPSAAIECAVMVLAAGTATPQLAERAGILIEQPESPGIVIRTDPRPPLLRTVSVLNLPALAADRMEIHLRQATDGSVRIGQGTQESLNRDDSQAHADELLDRARHYLPALAGATAFAEPVGYRPMPLDGLPVLGFAAKAPNLYVAFMHSGVTLAPIVADLATIEIVDGARVELLSPYRLERFASK